MPATSENSAVATALEMVSFHSNIKEKQRQRILRLLHNCTHFNSKKVMLKMLQARLQQYISQKLPDDQVEFRKGRGTRSQISNIRYIIEKAIELKKNLYCLWLCRPQQTGKFFKRW